MTDLKECPRAVPELPEGYSEDVSGALKRGRVYVARREPRMNSTGLVLCSVMSADDELALSIWLQRRLANAD